MAQSLSVPHTEHVQPEYFNMSTAKTLRNVSNISLGMYYTHIPNYWQHDLQYVAYRTDPEKFKAYVRRCIVALKARETVDA